METSAPMVIRCGTLLDGLGRSDRNVAVSIAGGRIADVRS